MKTNKNLRTVGERLAGGDGGRGKKLIPEQKTKNMKRSLFQEIEEDEEIGYSSINRKEESIVDYMNDDDEDFDDDFDEDDEYDDEEDK